MGKPVVASKTGGIPAMLNEEIGRLFAPGDAKSLADCIVRLYEKPDVLNKMQSRCISHVESNFSWFSVAERYLKAFETI